MRFKQDLMKKLNLNILDLTNQTVTEGLLDLPVLYCDIHEYPDYIALYSQPSDYHKTMNTAVSFYDYDNKFDGPKGLYQAIYYNDVKRLNEFKDRFKDVKYFISPDYSVCGDVHNYRNYHRLGRAREVAIWLTTECNAMTIPNISYANERDLIYITDGLKNVSIVAFSTKGKINDKIDYDLLTKAVKKVVDDLPKLKAIIVYDVTVINKQSNLIFSYAKSKGINVIIPNNMLKNRNIICSQQNTNEYA